jgi:hypothetical protein
LLCLPPCGMGNKVWFLMGKKLNQWIYADWSRS